MDIITWTGVFIKYGDSLKQESERESLKGSNLSNVDKSDIKGWGVHNFEDKQTLIGTERKGLL